jgi:hypothetical protein
LDRLEWPAERASFSPQRAPEVLIAPLTFGTNSSPIARSMHTTVFAGLICPTGKSAVARENLSIPSRKNISLVPSGKSPPLVFAVPHPKEGRTRNRHGRWVRDAMDALVSQGERYKRGRQSRVVLASRR